jgi:hypothetical protein
MTARGLLATRMEPSLSTPVSVDPSYVACQRLSSPQRRQRANASARLSGASAVAAQHSSVVQLLQLERAAACYEAGNLNEPDLEAAGLRAPGGTASARARPPEAGNLNEPGLEAAGLRDPGGTAGARARPPEVGNLAPDLKAAGLRDPGGTASLRSLDDGTQGRRAA